MTTRFASFLIGTIAFAADDVERVFRFANTPNVRAVQELSTVVRSIGEIRHAYADGAAQTLTVRAPQEQVTLAEWVIKELDRPPAEHAPATFEIRSPDGTPQTIRVLYVPPAADMQQAQEITTLVRSIGEIRHAFLYSSTGAMALRGSPDQIALAEWLLTEVAKNGRSSEAREFRLDGKGEDVVQVFHLSEAYTVERLQEIAKRTRTATQLRRLFTFNATRAIAARGTADQISTAERMLREHSR